MLHYITDNLPLPKNIDFFFLKNGFTMYYPKYLPHKNSILFVRQK